MSYNVGDIIISLANSKNKFKIIKINRNTYTLKSLVTHDKIDVEKEIAHDRAKLDLKSILKNL